MNNADLIDAGRKLQGIGKITARNGVVIAVGWNGALKYTEYEDKGIEPLLTNSPIIS
jgi:reactive chlorine resistance protein C